MRVDSFNQRIADKPLEPLAISRYNVLGNCEFFFLYFRK